VLGDAARLSSGYPSLANRIEKRCFTMIDMAHEGNDGGSGFKGFLFRFFRFFRNFNLNLMFMMAFRSIFLFSFKSKAMFFAEFGDRIELEGLVDIGKDLEAHQIGDDLEGLNAKERSEVLDGDRGLKMDDLLVGFRRFRLLGSGFNGSWGAWLNWGWRLFRDRSALYRRLSMNFLNEGNGWFGRRALCVFAPNFFLRLEKIKGLRGRFRFSRQVRSILFGRQLLCAG
jgi:hypothetical protein